MSNKKMTLRDLNILARSFLLSKNSWLGLCLLDPAEETPEINLMSIHFFDSFL